MDKTDLWVIEHCRRLRLKELATPLAPLPRPRYLLADGREVVYTGPFDPWEHEGYRLRQIERLKLCPPLYLLHTDHVVRDYYEAWKAGATLPAV